MQMMKIREKINKCRQVCVQEKKCNVPIQIKLKNVKKKPECIFVIYRASLILHKHGSLHRCFSTKEA
jgi:hypothetical protein